MREIKFRAWDKKEKKWIEIDQIEWGKNGIIYVCSTDGFEYDIKNIELIQFTGRKDKNNTDIYEGYIVEWISIGKKSGNVEDIGKKSNMGISEVFFKEGKFMCHKTIPIGHINKELKVIGNIYEYPEMLEGKQ